MTQPTGGEPDVAAVAALFADPRRARVLIALADGRALPAGRLAEEAGVAASTASNHLAILADHGLVTAIKQGRHRFYRLATPHVEKVLEALAELAPQKPISSLREHTRAHALRAGRTCYNHLAGKAGVRLFAEMIDSGWISGGDGRHDPGIDRLSAVGRGTHYRLTERGRTAMRERGIPDTALTCGPLRYCVDWTEQAHHLSGRLGSAITHRLLELGKIARGPIPRSILVNEQGSLMA